MAKEPVILLPPLQHLLAQTGENIRLARLRRKLSAARVAERAGISRNTLRTIEQGSSTVSMGGYLQVLFVLGLEKTILQLANDDVLGRKLQDAGLGVRARATKQNPSGNHQAY
ncbi:helix-turn-helix domain-containing protein [Hymenobacter sp. BT635]|uniref:Helix-turn-helix domain-containing protein n=1 Tax=Hymenobacter nitidus TaxID=2880929 RepID=A0ABS8AIX9_9BACT|nr:helix-turn-helix domain-containing protein [Hymenobacter nitidus]MCB2380388.1 helix-turn-helix domain-containing protein [Hymenobacter nitidus]